MSKARLLALITLLIIGSHISLALAIGHHKQGDRVPDLVIRTIDGNQISLDEPC
jgi:hypothetical protein